jgi:DNA-binding transcriptional ArsR family regulator
VIVMSTSHAAQIDDTLIALADPVRRGIVELLKVQPRRAGELATLLDTNAPLMSKHLKTLRDGALIEEERPAEDARVRVYRLRPERLNELRDWLSDVGKFWSEQLDSFKAAADVAAKRASNELPKAGRTRRARRGKRT